MIATSCLPDTVFLKARTNTIVAEKGMSSLFSSYLKYYFNSFQVTVNVALFLSI